MKKIYYIGDSTVAVNFIQTYPQTGMAQGLQLYVKPEVRIVSLAKNGRSTTSFLEEGRLEPVRKHIAPGDFLFIQFGHNDNKNDPARFTDPNTDFRDNLRIFIRTAREAGAYPLLITPIARRKFDEKGVFLPGSHEAYPDAIRQVGLQEQVPVADLTALTEAWLPTVGDEESKPYFMWPKDNTHLKPVGAVKMAGFLAAELERLGGPYAELLVREYDENDPFEK